MLTRLRRLFSDNQPQSDVSVLHDKLRQSALECDFWRGRFLESERERKQTESLLELERTRNREREDDLVNNCLRLAQLPFPRSRFSESTPNTDAEVNDAAQNEDENLQARARDYCVQVYGDEYTTDQLEQTVAIFKANPAYWLSN